MMLVRQRLNGLDKRALTLNLKGGHGFHTCKLLASLVTSEAGEKITQPWIEGREAKVKLSGKDHDHLCMSGADCNSISLNLCIFCV